jgi:hypothetical protein
VKRTRPPEPSKQDTDANLVELARQVIACRSVREQLSAAKRKAQEEILRAERELETVSQNSRDARRSLKRAIIEAGHKWIEVDGSVFTVQDDPDFVHFEEAPYRPEVA